VAASIAARWCNLAERRLEYLTELWETGRWRRFHSEIQFLQNIQEAKAAVETWRALARREASLDNNSVDLAWLGRRGTKPLPLTTAAARSRVRTAGRPGATAAATGARAEGRLPPRAVAAEKPAAVERQLIVAEQAPPAPSAAVVHQMPLPAARKLDA
jgi:uncharacterized repeat protein (TIGR03809 family)